MRQNAFSVLEMLVTLSLLGTLLLMSQVSISNLFRLKLERDAKELISSFDSYALLAQNVNRKIVINFEVGSSGISVNSPLGLPKPILSLSPRTRIETANFGNLEGPETQLIFYPSGAATAGKLVLADGINGSCSILQSASGPRRFTCTERG